MNGIHIFQPLVSTIFALVLLVVAEREGDVAFLDWLSGWRVHVVVQTPVQFDGMTRVQNIKVVRYQTLKGCTTPENKGLVPPAKVLVELALPHNGLYVFVYSSVGF